MAGTRTHHRVCNLCEAMCGLKIDIEGDRVVKIRGDEQDVFSRGHICPKALGLKDLHEDPDRLRRPLRRRSNGEFEEIDWETALDEVAAKMHAIQEAHGRDALGAYVGNPNVHNLGALIYAPQLLRTLRTKNRFSATSVDQLPAMLASYLMYGHQLLMPVPDLDRVEELVILGANPMASNGSIMSAGDIGARLKGIRSRGGRITVIDPRRTETAKRADEHHFIRPGSDAMLLFAVLREGLEAYGARAGHLDERIRGLEALRTLIADFTAERVAGPTGVDAAFIRELAARLWGPRPAALYARVGACVQSFGAVTMWAVNLINLLSGKLDVEGGMMFTEPAADIVDAPKGFGVGVGSFGRWRSRVRDLPEFGGELPSAVMAEEILTPGEGQIRGMLVLAGNPVLSTPDGRKLDEALASLECMVSVDMYVNETSRHAHYILPPTSQLERSHYDIALYAFAVRNVANWSPPAFEAPADARHDWQIVQGLHRRILALRGAPPAVRAREAVVARLGPDRLLDLALRVGPRGARLNPLGKGMSLRRLKAAPHGLDLGPLRRCLLRRMPRSQRHIDLIPDAMVRDLPRLREATDAGAPEGLTLIGRRDLRSNNSWMHNVPGLVKGPRRCTLKIHPADAEARGIEDGMQVALSSGVGRIELPAELTDDMMRGVVCAPHGFGHGRKGVRMKVASGLGGASVNDVTDRAAVDAVSGVSVLTGIEVSVEPAVASEVDAAQ